MDEIRRAVENHIQEDKRMFDSINHTLRAIEADQRFVRENHLTHIEVDMKAFALSSAKTANDMDWVKRLLFIAIGGTATSVINLFFQIFARQ